MKTRLDLPDELVMAAKMRAVLQGRTLKDLVADYLRQGLGLSTSALSSPQPNSLISIDANGLPVIRCRASVAARRMPVEKLLALANSKR
jgi:hypothetical protein